MKEFYNNLRLSQKLLLSSSAFLLPITVLFYFVLSGFGYHITFAKREIDGATLLVPLVKLMKSISLHESYTGLYLKDNQFDLNKIKNNEKEIENILSELQSYESLFAKYDLSEKSLKDAKMDVASVSQLSDNWRVVQSTWRSLLPDRNAVMHSRMNKDVQSLITRLGETSNLVLDPDLDSFCLMDLSLQILTDSQTRLNMLMNRGLELISKEHTPEEMSQFVTSADVLETVTLDNVRKKINISLREDKNFYGVSSSLQANMPPAMTEYETAVHNFITAIHHLEKSEDSSQSVNDFALTGVIAIETNLSFQLLSVNELLGLLHNKMTHYNRMRLSALVLSLIALIFAAGMVYVISRNITDSLKIVTDIAKQISSGRMEEAKKSVAEAVEMGLCMSSDSHSSDSEVKNEILQLSQSIAQMTYNLDNILTQVRQSGIKVMGSVTQIVASVRQLEATVAEQAASTTEVNATASEISKTVNQLANTMNKVTDMASETTDLASEGINGLKDIRETMHTLINSTQDISNKLGIISEKTENITQVITTITDVANQTNLLSLNASIEAEKAGEYGVGFSVVAIEIRRLADQAAVATLDIEETILEVQNAIKDGVAGVEQYTHQTRLSSEKTARISDELGKIIEHSRELGPQVEFVNSGIQVHSQSASQISNAMEQVNETAHSTSESLSEFRKIIEQLNEAVIGLQEVSRFSV